MNNLIGERFGRLLVVEYLGTNQLGRHYRAACKCGGVWEGAGIKLTRRYGATKSCGCLHALNKLNDLTGQTFGRLTVVEFASHCHESGHVKWLCKCECGTFKKCFASDMVSGATMSCGCWHREQVRKRHENERQAKQLVSQLERDRLTGDLIKSRLQQLWR